MHPDEFSDMHAALPRSARRRRHEVDRGVAIVIALVAVGAATLLGLALASSRERDAGTNDSLARTAAARAAAAGGLDMALEVVSVASLFTESAVDEEPMPLFEAVTIGSGTYAVQIRDLETSRALSRESTAFELVASATVAEVMQSARALGRLQHADSVVRVDLDLSEFAILVTADASGAISLGENTFLAAWRSAPMSALAEPVVLGSSTRQAMALAVDSTARAQGHVVLREGSFAEDGAERARQLADGVAAIPSNIHVPSVTMPSRPMPDLVMMPGSDPVEALTARLASGDGTISVAGDLALVRPGDRLVLDLQHPEAEEWIQLDVGGDLRMESGAVIAISVPTMIVVRGSLSLDSSAIEVAPDASLLLLVEGDAAATDSSYIGPERTSPTLDRTPWAPYPDKGAHSTVIMAQAGSAVTLEESSVLVGRIYAPAATVRIETQATVFGAIVGETVALDRGAQLFYDPSLDGGRGWLNPRSGIWNAGGVPHQAITEVAAFTDEELRALWESSQLVVEPFAGPIVVNAHVAMAGGAYDAEAHRSVGVGDTDDVPSDAIVIRGTIRDFHEADSVGGHPDFESEMLANNMAHGLVRTTLGPDGKPVLMDTKGARANPAFRDSSGRTIAPHLYSPALGDAAGTLIPRPAPTITSAETFAQWFRDVPGVNASIPVSLALLPQPDGSFRFDSGSHPRYRAAGGLDGFFPLEGRLLGNSAPKAKTGVLKDRNFHFTIELELEFVHDRAANQYFRFRGDDDVWVFINGMLVIDLGGTHVPQEQRIDLNRLGLADGSTCTLKMFFAERRRNGSNCLIDTNLALETVREPETTDPTIALETVRAARAEVRARLAAGDYDDGFGRDPGQRPDYRRQYGAVQFAP